MALTAPFPFASNVSAERRDMPGWAAAILAVAGNIVVMGIVATAFALAGGAAFLVFGAPLLEQF